MRTLLLAIPLALSLFIVGCSSGDGDSSDSSRNETEKKQLELSKKLDLSEHGYPFTIMVPEDAAFVDEKYNGLITNNNGFEIEITDYGTTVEERKEEWSKNDVNVVKEWLVESDNGFVTKNEVMNQEAHYFFYSVNAGESGFELENVKVKNFTEQQAMDMYRACETIEVLEAAE